MVDRNLAIVFPLFPGGLALDFTGPHMVFSRLPGARVMLASKEGGQIQAEGGITMAGLHRLSEIDACDIVCVLGGGGVNKRSVATYSSPNCTALPPARVL